MRWFFWFVTTPVVSAVIILIFSNQAKIVINFWPLIHNLEVPEGLSFFLFFILGYGYAKFRHYTAKLFDSPRSDQTYDSKTLSLPKNSP